MIWRCIFLLMCVTPAFAQSVVPTRTIRANAIISETDVILNGNLNTGGYEQIANVVGQEARIVLYPGKPILVDDIGPPAIVTRNQLVRIAFNTAGLQITTEGRALERGAAGDRVRIMNLSSRTTLFGQVLPDGTIEVHQ